MVARGDIQSTQPCVDEAVRCVLRLAGKSDTTAVNPRGFRVTRLGADFQAETEGDWPGWHMHLVLCKLTGK